MKKYRYYFILILISILFSGCTNSIQKKADDFIKHPGSLDGTGTITNVLSSQKVINHDYPEEKIYGLCKENGRVCFSYKYITSDGKDFTIVSMLYTNKDISPTVNYVVLYPDKKLDESLYLEDFQKEKIIELEQDFQEKLKLFNITWKDLDEIIMHLMIMNYD